jgi:hypothetical protein
MTSSRIVYAIFAASLIATVALAANGLGAAAVLTGVVAFATGSVTVAHAIGYNPKPVPSHIRYIEQHGG